MSDQIKDMTPEEETADAAATSEAKEEAKEQTTYTLTHEEMQKFESLAQMVTETSDKYLRLAAEYDNYRKRTAKEKENLYGDAKADTIKPFLDVYDNLLRGAAGLAEDDPHRQGMDMIVKQFLAVLEKLGVKPIEAEGKPFDVNVHNAVMHIDDENYPENTVVEVFQQGFMLGDKVLRFAMVKVAN